MHKNNNNKSASTFPMNSKKHSPKGKFKCLRQHLGINYLNM